jgi:hypothetical protein
LFHWTRGKKIEMPQVKQERERPQVNQESRDKKEAPGDVVVCLDNKEEKRDAPGDVNLQKERGPR